MKLSTIKKLLLNRQAEKFKGQIISWSFKSPSILREGFRMGKLKLNLCWIMIGMFAVTGCQSDVVFDLDHPPLDKQKIAMTAEFKAGERPRIFVSKTIDDVKSQKSLSEFVLQDAIVVLFEDGNADTLKFSKDILHYESSKPIKPGSKYVVRCTHPLLPEAVSEEVMCPQYPKLLNKKMKILSDTSNICSGRNKENTHNNVLYTITIGMEKTEHDQTYYYNYFNNNQHVCNIYSGHLIGSEPEESKIENRNYQFLTSATIKKGSQFELTISAKSKEYLYEYKTSDPLGAIETGLVSAGPLYTNVKGGLGIIKASSVLNVEF